MVVWVLNGTAFVLALPVSLAISTLMLRKTLRLPLFATLKYLAAVKVASAMLLAVGLPALLLAVSALAGLVPSAWVRNLLIAMTTAVSDTTPGTLAPLVVGSALFWLLSSLLVAMWLEARWAAALLTRRGSPQKPQVIRAALKRAGWATSAVVVLITLLIWHEIVLGF